LARGLGLSVSAAEQIQGRLSGEQLTNEVSELLSKLTDESLQPGEPQRNRIPFSAFPQDEEGMLQRIERVEGAGQSASVIKRSLLMLHCRNQDMDKAIQEIGVIDLQIDLQITKTGQAHVVVFVA